VAGRFLRQQRTTGRAWVGSDNQTVHFLTTRYGLPDLATAPVSEILVQRDGALVFTGFPEDELIADPSLLPGKTFPAQRGRF
jgi:hypothetical protein